MEDLHEAGGIGAVMRDLKGLFHLDCMTVSGGTVGERLTPQPYVDGKIIHSGSEPVQPEGGLVALVGSLAPNGAMLKRAAAGPRLFEYEAALWSSQALRI